MDVFAAMSAGYQYHSVFWMAVSVHPIGIGLNILFLYLIFISNGQRRPTDVIIISATVVKIGHSVTLVIKAVMIFTSKRTLDFTTIYIFASIEFLLYGLYTWLLMSLSIARLLVVKHIINIQDTSKQVKRSRLFVIISCWIMIIATTAFIAGECIGNSRISKVALSVAVQLPLPFVASINIGIAVYLIVVTYKRQRMVRLGTRRRSRSVVSATRNVRFPYMVLCLLIFGILPSIYCCISRMVIRKGIIDYKYLNRYIITDGIISSFLPLLNSISLGMFSRDKRTLIKRLFTSRQLSSVAPQISIQFVSSKNSASKKSQECPPLSSNRSSDECFITNQDMKFQQLSPERSQECFIPSSPESPSPKISKSRSRRLSSSSSMSNISMTFDKTSILKTRTRKISESASLSNISMTKTKNSSLCLSSRSTKMSTTNGTSKLSRSSANKFLQPSSLKTRKLSEGCKSIKFGSVEDIPIFILDELPNKRKHSRRCRNLGVSFNLPLDHISNI